jgi:hypothetical protein
MQRTFIEVNTSRFTLPEDLDCSELKTTIRDAIRRGGDFVDVPREGRSVASVFVSAASTIVLRDETVADQFLFDADQDRLLRDHTFTDWEQLI